MLQDEDLGPVDKPVRPYEIALCIAALLLVGAALRAHFPAAEFTGMALVVLLIASSLWKLLVPPHLSETRCAFVLIGLLCLSLLLTA